MFNEHAEKEDKSSSLPRRKFLLIDRVTRD